MRPFPLLGWALLLFFVACSRSPKDPLLYVSNEDGGDVAVVDPNTGQVLARIAVGKRPRGIKLSRDGKLLYVALSGSPRAGPGVDETKLPPADRSADGIGVVDLASRKLVRTVACGQDPEAFEVSPDGKTLYVSNEETAEMTALDPSSGQVLARVPVGREPEGVTVRPDGKFVYVTCEAEDEVVAIDTSTLKAVARIPVGARPRAVVFDKEGVTAFVTDEAGGKVSVFDATTNTAEGDIQMDVDVSPTMRPRPMGEVLSPDGNRLYVSCGRDGSVAVVDTATRKEVRRLPDVGKRPWGIGISADGKRLFTANGPSNDLSIVDVDTGQVTKRVPTGDSPWGVAMGARP
jgi:YVTN family beta-propeller protein